MKACAAILLLFLALGSKAQYQSVFGQNSTEWSELFSNLGFTITANYSVVGDTTIAGKNYKKVNSSIGNDFFLHEDIVTGKLWAAFFDLGFNESLVADFSLAVGDTFYIVKQPFLFTDTAIVDSVYFVSGKKHIRFNYGLFFNNGFHRLILIEGTGSTFGLFFSYPYNLSPVLLCKSKDNVQEYVNTLFNGNCTVTGLESSQFKERVRLIRQGDGYIIESDAANEPFEV